MNAVIGKVTIESVALYVSDLISKESGNVLREDQQSMVMSRLKKRMLDLGNIDPEQYYSYLQDHLYEETSHLVSLLTTHHTFFFREFYHFEYLLGELPTIVERVRSRGGNTIEVYSAACSKGQEVYSLAMFFEQYLPKIAPDMNYRICGSDIDPECIKIAQNGVYSYSEIKKVPNYFLKGNWQRGTGKIEHFVRVKPHLKEKCSFKVENLFELSKAQKYDIIFCRNVFIYFDHDDIRKITNSFRPLLHEHGLFITGLCESLKSLDLESFYTLGTSIYTFTPPVVEDSVVVENIVSLPVQKASLSSIPSPIRLLVVDDSKSVQKLLGKVFASDSDFEIVGYANDGLEAEEFVKNNDIDAMTLDIHMPNKDGVGYLRDNFNKDHPKVIVISSASRDDLKYAQKTLEYGAADFVEKPSLNNLAKKAEEIKSKIKMSFFNSENISDLSIDRDFKKDYIITDLSKKSRVLVANYSSLKKLNSYFAEFTGNEPATFVLCEGNSQMLEILKEGLQVDSKYKLEILEDERTEFLNNTIYICDLDNFFEKNKNALDKKIATCVFGSCSNKASESIMNIDDLYLLIEDIGDVKYDLTEVANDIFPCTSFYHISTEYLAKE